MKRRPLLVAAAATSAAYGVARHVLANKLPRPRKVVVVLSSAVSGASALDAFRDALRELGHVDGQDIAIEVRYPVGQVELEWPESADEGGLLAYGSRLTETYRQLAHFASRILNGAKPGELPIEQPTRFEFVVNMNTARAIGLAIPPSLRVRATKVIE